MYVENYTFNQNLKSKYFKLYIKGHFHIHRSPEWEKISSSEKKDMGLTFDEDGDFW